MPTTPRSFGRNLRAARLAVPLTQRQLAVRLGYKAPTPITQWERAANVPEPETVRKLAAAIGCAPAVLLRHVVTAYDALRQSTTAPAAVDEPADPITATERRWRDLGRALASAGLLHSQMSAIEEVVRAAANVHAPRGAADARVRGRRPTATTPRAPAAAPATRPRRPRTVPTRDNGTRGRADMDCSSR